MASPAARALRIVPARTAPVAPPTGKDPRTEASALAAGLPEQVSPPGLAEQAQAAGVLRGRTVIAARRPTGAGTPARPPDRSRGIAMTATTGLTAAAHAGPRRTAGARIISGGLTHPAHGGIATLEAPMVQMPGRAGALAGARTRGHPAAVSSGDQASPRRPRSAQRRDIRTSSLAVPVPRLVADLAAPERHARRVGRVAPGVPPARLARAVSTRTARPGAASRARTRPVPGELPGTAGATRRTALPPDEAKTARAPRVNVRPLMTDRPVVTLRSVRPGRRGAVARTAPRAGRPAMAPNPE